MARISRWGILTLLLVVVLAVTGPAIARPPLISINSIADQEVNPWFEGVTFTYTVTYQVTDPPCFGEEVIFSLDQAPSGMSIGAFNGKITWSPTSSQREKTHTVTVRATAWYNFSCGGGSLAYTRTFQIFVC